MTDQTSQRVAGERSSSAESTGRPVSRRTFIKVGVVAGTGLTLGVAWRLTRDAELPASDATFVPNAFLRIDEDGSVTVLIDKAEMGQGVTTALPQMIAEELDVAWDDITFELDRRRPHDVDAAWGFWNLRPYRDGRVLVTYGVMADFGGGIGALPLPGAGAESGSGLAGGEPNW